MKALKHLLIVVLLINATSLFAQNTIPASGNVGIGTTTPNTTLDVNGNANIDSSLTVRDTLKVEKKLVVDQDIRIEGKSLFKDVGKFKDKLVVDGLTRMNGDAKVFGDLKLPNLTTTSNVNLFLTTNVNGKVVGVEKGIITTILYQPPKSCLRDQNGNLLPMWKQNPNPNYGILYTGTDCPARVGIGIDMPEANLHVVGSSFLKGNVGIGVAPSIQKLYVKGNSILDGKVGVNTTDLTAQFNIKAIMKTGLIVETIHKGEGEYGIQSKVNRDSTKAIAVFNTNSNEETFRVNGNGNVYATKVVVQETPFPDYVFKKDYNLLSLTELEAYVTTNKHLPNMPTAKEVENNGADLGEINRVLVEKIEELTLYTIQQQKAIDKLIEKVENLKK